MTRQEIIKVLANEKACVIRNINGCDRDCGRCDLALEDKEIIGAYDSAVSLLQRYDMLVALLVEYIGEDL